MKSASEQQITRLAPSPTGALHLGNASTFLINWAVARREGWKVLLRIEDLMGPRVRPDGAADSIETLQWLGLDWDDGPLVQSADLDPYREAMSGLAHKGLVYPCELSRSQVEAAASAPQEGVFETVYSTSLRPETGPCRFSEVNEQGQQTNWRFVVPTEMVSFDDRVRGAQCIDPLATFGDFIVWTKIRQPAYQLAVVVDDHRQGVTQVIRGNDLLNSAGRQLLLYRALGYLPEPVYSHLLLVRGEDGRRLAKRHGDSRLASYRAAGTPPERIIGLIASWCGVLPPGERRPMDVREFVGAIDLATISPDDVIFTPEDHQWLLTGIRR